MNNDNNNLAPDLTDIEEARKAFIANEILTENIKIIYGYNLHDCRRTAET